MEYYSSFECFCYYNETENNPAEEHKKDQRPQ